MSGPLRGPALFDETAEGQPVVMPAPAAEDRAVEDAVQPAGIATAPETALREPLLFDMPEGLSAGRIDQGWAPGLLRPRAAPPGSLGWIAGGLGVLLIGWLALSAVGFVADQFARSAAMGTATALVFGAGLPAVLWGLWREVRSFRQLREAEGAWMEGDDPEFIHRSRGAPGRVVSIFADPTKG